jgi:GWxTD domain-containing protein
MKVHRFNLLLCLLLISTIGTAWSQRMFRQGREHKENPFGRSLFQMAVYNFADLDSGLSRIEFHVSFVNDILTFVKEEENIYRASYEVVLETQDKKGFPLQDKSVSDEVVVHTFEETNSRSVPIRQNLVLSLTPGRYKFKLELVDLETRKSLQREREVELRDFSRDRLHLSDVMFVDQLQIAQGKILKLIPNLDANFAFQNSDFAILFEAYSPSNADSLSIGYQIFDESQELITKDVQKRVVETQAVRQIITLKDKITCPGSYFLVVETRVGKNVATLRKRFTVQWGNVRLDTENIALAIKPLSIIAKKADIRAMEEADENEQEELFEAFWVERDPTPETERNELKDEFFRRLDFTNRNFVVFASEQEGWETDRGKVYIQYGPPTEVERQPTDINMPTAEIWYYAKIDRHFIFSDPSGTGNYRLVRVE